MTARRTALIVVLPEADEILDDFRKRHDPALARGIPAHVTVLFPFAEASAIDDALLSSATELAPLLPLRSRASAVAPLEEQADGRWAERCSFPLGRP